MASAGVARPPAVSARAIHAWAAGPPGVCTRMATSRLSTRSLARQERMTPVGGGLVGADLVERAVAVGQAGGRRRHRRCRPPVLLRRRRERAPVVAPPRPVRSSASEPGPDGCQGLPELRDAGDHETCESRAADDHGTDQHGHERARAATRRATSSGRRATTQPPARPAAAETTAIRATGPSVSRVRSGRRAGGAARRRRSPSPRRR